MRKPRTRTKRSTNQVEDQRIRMADEIGEFEEFREQILPVLRKALINGISADEIYKRFEALAAARAVSIAVTDPDHSKAMSAIKDILDRSQGKAKERTEVTHRYSKLSDQELDALLASEAQDTATASQDNQDGSESTDSDPSDPAPFSTH